MELANDDNNVERKLFGRISKLLLLHDIKTVKGASVNLLASLDLNFLVPSGMTILNKINLSNIYLDKQNFLSNTNMAPGRQGNGDVIEIIPSLGECFDYGFMVFSALDSKPFAVFIDTKSGKEYPEEVNDTFSNSTVNSIEYKDNDKIKFDFKDLPDGGIQATYILNIIDSISLAKPNINVADGSLFETLKNKNFLYIYVTTAKESISFGVDDNVMQLGELNSHNLLSFFLDAYRIVTTNDNNNF